MEEKLYSAEEFLTKFDNKKKNKNKKKTKKKPATVKLSYAKEINRIKCRCNLLLFWKIQQVLFFFSYSNFLFFLQSFLYLYSEEIWEQIYIWNANNIYVYIIHVSVSSVCFCYLPM